MGYGGLAQPGRAVKDRVIERFSPLLCRLDADPQRLLHALLPNILIKSLWTQGLLDAAFFLCQLGMHDSIAHDGWFSARLILFQDPGYISSAAVTRLGLDWVYYRNQADRSCRLWSDPEGSVPFSLAGIVKVVPRLDCRNEPALRNCPSLDSLRGRSRTRATCWHTMERTARVSDLHPCTLPGPL
jgi:hypothetical protein